MKRHVFGIVGCALCLAQSVLAQIEKNAVGTIIASIGDASYEGETLDVPAEGTATAEFRSLGPITSISIQGHDPKAESIMSNVLSLDIMVMGNDASATVTTATVSYFPDGMSAAFYNNEHSATQAQVVFDTLSLEDGASRAVGRFTAVVCRKDDYFSETDETDCIPVEGVFDTVLRNAG
ncbi:hypothetical protein [Celeribacter sp.]|uniref:hypothetical protein n=1 Tax=Celeribacter sp. TaxID=1890673 RepID=UPI003A944528